MALFRIWSEHEDRQLDQVEQNRQFEKVLTYIWDLGICGGGIDNLQRKDSSLNFFVKK